MSNLTGQEDAVIDRHLMRLRARHELSAAEEEAVRSCLLPETRFFEARSTVIRRGQKLGVSTLVLEGLLCRYKDLRNGQRQITELHVAGDFADLHSFTLKRLEHNVGALTDVVVAYAPHERIRDVIEAHPRIGRLFWFSTNLDAANHREWELSLGQRSALQRAGSLFCELHIRLKLVGLAEEDGFGLPLTQGDLAECLGLTPVHVSRVLRQLREAGLVSFRSGRVTIHDADGLRAASDFDPAYLYLEAEPL